MRPGARSIQTVPLPNTSLSPVRGSTLRFSEIHTAKPLRWRRPWAGQR